MKKLDSFFKETLILSISNSAMGAFRFVFSIILTSRLGAEGLGLYALVMPIYDLFVCLASGGLVAAISRKGAEFYAKKKMKSFIKVIRVSVVFEIIWSSLIFIGVFFGSDFISTYIIKDVRTAMSIKLISPAIIFVSLGSIYKAYFFSATKAVIPAYIDILEKVVRIVTVIFVLDYFGITGIAETVSAVYGAFMFGEIVSLIILWLSYKFSKRKLDFTREKGSENPVQILFDVLVVMVPLLINSFITSLLSTASTLIVPRRLVSSGFTYKEALSLIGEFSGMAFTITLFPAIVIASMSTLIIPEVSKELAIKNFYGLQRRIIQTLKLSLWLGIITIIIAALIPRELGEVFYKKPHIAPYIFASALTTPFFYLESTTFGLLSGLGKQKIILRNSIIMSIVEIVCLYIFTGFRVLNIYGFAIAFFITGLVAFVLNFIEIKKMIPIKIPITDLIIYCLLGVLVFLVFGILNNVIPTLPFNLKLVTIVFGVAATYIFLARRTTKYLE